MPREGSGRSDRSVKAPRRASRSLSTFRDLRRDLDERPKPPVRNTGTPGGISLNEPGCVQSRVFTRSRVSICERRRDQESLPRRWSEVVYMRAPPRIGAPGESLLSLPTGTNRQRLTQSRAVSRALVPNAREALSALTRERKCVVRRRCRALVRLRRERGIRLEHASKGLFFSHPVRCSRVQLFGQGFKLLIRIRTVGEIVSIIAPPLRTAGPKTRAGKCVCAGHDHRLQRQRQSLGDLDRLAKRYVGFEKFCERLWRG
jgi:hypothetical protein